MKQSHGQNTVLSMSRLWLPSNSGLDSLEVYKPSGRPSLYVPAKRKSVKKQNVSVFAGIPLDQVTSLSDLFRGSS